MTNLNKTIQQGSETGKRIGAELTQEVLEKIKQEAKKPKMPTLEEQIKMVDKKMPPDYIKIDFETCYNSE